jgi:Flp pilus assembly CpaE family ATPase
LYEAKRAIEALVRIGVAGDRLRLIVNHLDDMPDFSERELSRILAVPVHAKLPNAGDQLHQSVAQQKLIAENSEFGEQIGRLARQVAGRPEEKRKRRFSQLLSFAAGPQS